MDSVRLCSRHGQLRFVRLTRPGSNLGPGQGQGLCVRFIFQLESQNGVKSDMYTRTGSDRLVLEIKSANTCLFIKKDKSSQNWLDVEKIINKLIIFKNEKLFWRLKESQKLNMSKRKSMALYVNLKRKCSHLFNQIKSTVYLGLRLGWDLPYIQPLTTTVLLKCVSI